MLEADVLQLYQASLLAQQEERWISNALVAGSIPELNANSLLRPFSNIESYNYSSLAAD